MTSRKWLRRSTKLLRSRTTARASLVRTTSSKRKAITLIDGGRERAAEVARRGTQNATKNKPRHRAGCDPSRLLCRLALLDAAPNEKCRAGGSRRQARRLRRLPGGSRIDQDTVRCDDGGSDEGRGE